MKIYDSVHGFIHFNTLEGALIDTEVFQRLHYIHQLGISYMIYPGASHTRFEHSLGAMHLASQIFDQIALDENKGYWKQILRLAALCHDLGHLPFSHVAEKALLGASGHETWTLKIIESSYLKPVWEKVEGEYPGYSIAEDIAKIALGEERLKNLHPDVKFTEEESIYSQIITGDFFGSDRIDYLLRDAQATGLSYGLFDYVQLIEMLAILPGIEGKMILGVEENGIESCEALLLARHFMQRRVYQHPTSKAYGFHLARFMKKLYQDPQYTSDLDHYLTMSEPDVLCALQAARKDRHHPGHLDAVCLFDRKKRFQAIHLSGENILSQLETFKEKIGISESNIHWDLAAKHSLKGGLDLPILRKNAQITSASEFSEIMIPQTKKNWLYLAPEYSFEL